MITSHTDSSMHDRTAIAFGRTGRTHMYMHVHHGKILQVGRVKEYMLISPVTLSSSPVELYSFSPIKTSFYLMKSSVMRLSFPWKIQTSIFRRSHPASGCYVSLLKHAHSCTLLIAYESGVLLRRLGTQKFVGGTGNTFLCLI